MTKHREVSLPREFHRDQGTDGAHRGGPEHRLVDKVSWMNVATQDGPFDMYVEDLASLMTVDQNAFLSLARRPEQHAPHRSQVDEYYRATPGDGPAKRKAIAREFRSSARPTLLEHDLRLAVHQVAQPWMKDYVYQAEFKVLYKKVWLTSSARL